jgi:hypothetical protein
MDVVVSGSIQSPDSQASFWNNKVSSWVVRFPSSYVTSAFFALIGFGVLTRSGVVADEPLRLRELQVEPAVVQLGATNRLQQILITGVRADGQSVDLTHLAVIESSDSAVARIADGIVIGDSDGTATLRVSCQGLNRDVSVEVKQISGDPRVDFANDLLPLFSKLGCNSGGCHGKSNHTSGFKLSVFGFDPGADFDALVKDDRGRRIFPASPEFSLFLRKATGVVPHGGGQRLPIGSPDYDLMLAWVRQGTPTAQPDSPALVRLSVSPVDRILDANSQQQILATAHYSDGSVRDVTSAAGYSSNAPLVAEVDRAGVVRTGQIPGEAVIGVHYMGQVASVQLQLPRMSGYLPFEFPAKNGIDDLVRVKFKKIKLVPSELVDDATFLRRLLLDTIGTLPTSDETREFLADPAADKRSRWIDGVLERTEYADYWALVWADLLLVDRQKLGERGAYELHRWLREQFASNRRYDAWVTELVTATGNSGTNGPVNFFRAAETPEELARTVSQAFLGVRMECAQCHHHPFEKWSQEDFYGLAGYFNGLERKPIATNRVFVYHTGLKESRIPFSNKLVPVRPLDGNAVTVSDGDPRQELARWLVASDNPWFAKLAANRLWKHFVGRGLVEPEDDLRSTNPSTNEPLLALLSQSLIEHDFDLKELMRLILNSRTYQLSSLTNPGNQDDEQNFSHHYVRRLPAEVLLDAICKATGEPEIFPGRPRGTRAIELWDNRLPSYFLEIFGRPERTSPCECGRTSEPTMSQALHLMNAPEVESKIGGADGRVAQLMRAGSDKDMMVDELCLGSLGRFPNESERRIADRLFETTPPQQAAEDFLWTLLNSYDFLFIK